MKAALLVVLALAVTARTRLTGTVLGQPVSVPVLWLIAAAEVLALAAALLWLAFIIWRDGWLSLRSVAVTT
jgi:hypothetical protein